MVFIKRWLQAISLGILLFTVSTWVSAFPGNARSISAQALAFSSLSQTAPPLVSYLPPGNAITDGKALLRYALPIDSPEIRKVQKDLEDFSEWLRSKRWGPIKSNIVKIERILNRSSDKLLATVSPADQAQAKTLIGQLQAGLMPLREAVEAKDKEQVWLQRSALLDTVGALEALMVKSFPYEVPAEYSGLPQLKGRATVEFTTNKGSMTAVVDGYSAPVTAGNFVDLVQRGFYDGLEFTRAEDFYVVQIGDPPGEAEGFIDPDTGEYRAIPLEVLVQGDTEPTYGITLEDAGRYLDKPVLPFSAYGTLGMARPGDDPNGGSSQFFFFLFEPELTPAGLNLLDGRYSVFGYVIENKEVLENLKQGDKIISARVVKGAENLVEPQAA
ncbi:MAG: peptidylprolyl isomerase [Leptolyngbyaceae cyanobacterium RM2_2_4]|nr:peptidylprolyl isomerase [Leptolyngbyaceae cyanobacterium RM2_2_4]